MMRRGMKNTRVLKVRRYAARLIYLNEYLASFLGENLYDKFDVTELNEILSNRMPNIRSKQAYFQGFNWEYILFKNTTNMFERMEILESIYKGVVEIYFKNLPGKMPTVLVTSGI